MEAVRINKYLSEIGFCSRRAADKLIEQGRITINGKPVEMGMKVNPQDQVAVDGEKVGKKTEKPVYIAFNKPVGIVCTTDTKVEKDNIIDYINSNATIIPISIIEKAPSAELRPNQKDSDSLPEYEILDHYYLWL